MGFTTAFIIIIIIIIIFIAYFQLKQKHSSYQIKIIRLYKSNKKILYHPVVKIVESPMVHSCTLK